MKSPWQLALQNAITEPHELLEILQLDPALLPGAEQAKQLFRLRVPRGFVARMQKGDVNDPLLKQILPLENETLTVPGFSDDPIGDQQSNPLPGLLHKYHGRVLLTLTGACAVNCRFCFRREFPYENNNPGNAGWQKVVDYIREDDTIKEVILSGGDPLLATDNTINELLHQLDTIPHLTTLRIHSRLPIVLPQRITNSFCSMLNQSRLKTVMVIHCNHPNEIDNSVVNALTLCRDHGIVLLNQAVLLRGVNDDAEILAQLSQELFQHHVLPYYLHMMDRVTGAAHFEVNDARAKQIYEEVQALLPGYLVPKLVRAKAEHPNKILINATSNHA